MIALTPPLWSIILLALVVGAAALFVVVVGFLWIWGRREEPEPEREELSMVGVQIVNNTVVWTRHGIGVPRPLGPRPFDWAHRIKHLAPDHYITGRGIFLGTTEWPPR